MPWYVYEHWRPDTGICFYVGAGRGKRAGNMKARNERHLAIQAELAEIGMCVEVQLVQSNLTRAQAHALEIERIAFWRRRNVELANKGIGGPGTTGLRHSAESRARRSAAMMGNTRGKGTPKSEAWKAKARERNLGKKHTEETRRKISEKAKLRAQSKAAEKHAT